MAANELIFQFKLCLSDAKWERFAPSWTGCFCVLFVLKAPQGEYIYVEERRLPILALGLHSAGWGGSP